jgi:hypothetical protein
MYQFLLIHPKVYGIFCPLYKFIGPNLLVNESIETVSGGVGTFTLVITGVSHS